MIDPELLLQLAGPGGLSDDQLIYMAWLIDSYNAELASSCDCGSRSDYAGHDPDCAMISKRSEQRAQFV